MGLDTLEANRWRSLPEIHATFDQPQQPPQHRERTRCIHSGRARRSTLRRLVDGVCQRDRRSAEEFYDNEATPFLLRTQAQGTKSRACTTTHAYEYTLSSHEDLMFPASTGGDIPPLFT